MLFAFTGLMLLSLICGYLMYVRNPGVSTIAKHQLPTVSIIIPARDEADKLPKLLQSIEQQNIAADVIVVNDGSTDNTAAIAEEFGVRVIHFNNLSDWKGKTAACYEGTRHAQGELLAFMDADTWFEDDTSLRRIITSYNQGLIAIQPYHITKHWYEQLSVMFNILTVTGMNIFSIIRPKENTGAFGPFILCSYEDYHQTGGHKGAAGAMIEGFALADHFHDNGLPVTLLLGRGTLNFRMYPHGLRSMIDGWAKHFATGATKTLPSVMALIVMWMMGSVTLPLFIIWGGLTTTTHLMIAIISYLIYSSYFYVISKRTGSFTRVTALLFPVAFSFFIYVFLQSAYYTFIRKEVKWKGRRIKF